MNSTSKPQSEPHFPDDDGDAVDDNNGQTLVACPRCQRGFRVGDLNFLVVAEHVEQWVCQECWENAVNGRSHV